MIRYDYDNYGPDVCDWSAYGDSVTAYGECVTVRGEFCDLNICEWSVVLLDYPRRICDCVTCHRDMTAHSGLCGH